MIKSFEWQLEYSEHYNFFLSLSLKGKKSPLDDMPKDDIDIIWFKQAFYVLSSSRSSNGYGSNPISISDIISLFKIKQPLIDELLSLKILQKMDLLYLEKFRNRNTEENEGET